MFTNVLGDNDMVINVHTKQKSKTSEPVMARIIRWPKVHDKVGMCRSHVHQLISKGLFPAQIKLTPNGRASGWIESEVNEWLEQRIADSRCNNAAPAYGDSL